VIAADVLGLIQSGGGKAGAAAAAAPAGVAGVDYDEIPHSNVRPLRPAPERAAAPAAAAWHGLCARGGGRAPLRCGRPRAPRG
jgi:hypothetical protein